MSDAVASRIKPVLATGAGIALWLALFWRGPLINDVAWQLWIGERLNGGATLYGDILEVNPPLWFWLNAWIDGLARSVAVEPFHGLLIFIAASAAASMAAGLILATCRTEQVAIVGVTIAFLLVSSPYALGQREQFAFLAAAPYVLLVARRIEGKPVIALLAIAIGLFAAMGLLLKPYFLLVPLVLEGWLLLRLRRVSLRPEVIAFAIAGLAYAAAILWAAPAYLTTMLPLISTAYDGYDNDLAGLIFGPDVLAPLFLLVGCFAASRGEANDSLKALLLGGAAFLAAGLWQFKGFGYHFLPALGCALLALLLALHRLRSARAPIVAGVLLGLFLIGATIQREPVRNDQAAAIATAKLPRGSTILALSESASIAWPLVSERGFTWPSRHMAHWMLAEVWIAQAEGRADPALQELGRRIVREAAADIVRSRPAMLLFDRRCDHASGGIITFYRADPAFAAAMQAYERVEDVDYLTIYRRKS